MKNNTLGFSLVELLVAMTIFSVIMLTGFFVLSSVNAGKVKLMEATQITKDASYFAEKLYEQIKLGGGIDYEEYFARKVRGSITSSGHYLDPTGYGNYGDGGNFGTTLGSTYYYCLSGDNVATKLSGSGCYQNGAITGNNQGKNFSGSPTRYGQYAFQFVDYNSNYDADTCNAGMTPMPGDENGDCVILGDDDDEHLGLGPSVYTGGTNVRELYLISGDGKKRTFFRWNWKRDPDAPASAPCGTSTMGSGCLGNIQVLRMVGSDEGLDHNSGSDEWVNDGKIDTWRIASDFDASKPLAGSGGINLNWQDIFPASMSVTNFEVYPYPNIDRRYAWKNANPSINHNPYVRVKVRLTPSWKKRSMMQGDIPSINLSTTINLSDYFTY